MGITFLKLVGGMGALWAASKMALEWTGNMSLVRASVRASAAWVADIYGLMSAPSPHFTMVIFGLSVSLVGLLVYIEKQRSHPSRFTGRLSRRDSRREQSDSGRSSVNVAFTGAISYQQFQKEWEGLEEGDREIIREIVLKGGLLESDITALLKARGFIQYDGAYEPIAERVSFIQCDYTGYHSIRPAWQAGLNEKIHEEFRDDSFSNELR